MIKVCSYCLKILGYKCETCGAFLIQVREKANRGYCYKCRKHVDLDAGGSTHGACDPCLEKELAAIRQDQKKGGADEQRSTIGTNGAAVPTGQLTSETAHPTTPGTPRPPAAPQVSVAPGPRRADGEREGNKALSQSVRTSFGRESGVTTAETDASAEMPTGAIPSSVAAGWGTRNEPTKPSEHDSAASRVGWNGSTAPVTGQVATDSPSDSPPTGYSRQEWAQLEAAHLNHISQGGYEG